MDTRRRQTLRVPSTTSVGAMCPRGGAMGATPIPTDAAGTRSMPRGGGEAAAAVPRITSKPLPRWCRIPGWLAGEARHDMVAVWRRLARAVRRSFRSYLMPTSPRGARVPDVAGLLTLKESSLAAPWIFFVTGMSSMAHSLASNLPRMSFELSARELKRKGCCLKSNSYRNPYRTMPAELELRIQWAWSSTTCPCPSPQASLYSHEAHALARIHAGPPPSPPARAAVCPRPVLIRTIHALGVSTRACFQLSTDRF